MKHPEEGALGGLILAGNPVADPMMAGISWSSEAGMAPPGAAPATVLTGPGHQAQLEPDRDSDQLIGDNFCPPNFSFLTLQADGYLKCWRRQRMLWTPQAKVHPHQQCAVIKSSAVGCNCSWRVEKRKKCVIGGTSMSVDIAVGLCSERRFTFSFACACASYA